jgi:hypothetical protein
VVLGELGNFPLWENDLGHCVGGFGWFWVVLGELGNFSLWGVDLGHCVGGFRGVRQFSLVGSRLGTLCMWFWVVLGELGNFSILRVDLGHFVGGFGWFWGS